MSTIQVSRIQVSNRVFMMKVSSFRVNMSEVVIMRGIKLSGFRVNMSEMVIMRRIQVSGFRVNMSEVI